MLYIDMDGVLAVWDKNATMEDTKRPGYFRARACQENMAQALRELSDLRVPIAILSAVYRDGTAAEDKKAWLADHGLGEIPRIFVPYGSRKKDFAGPGILVDDYTRNLREWAAEGWPAVKFRNQVNGTRGTWTGLAVSADWPAEQLVSSLYAWNREFG